MERTAAVHDGSWRMGGYSIQPEAQENMECSVKQIEQMQKDQVPGIERNFRLASFGCSRGIQFPCWSPCRWLSLDTSTRRHCTGPNRQSTAARSVPTEGPRRGGRGEGNEPSTALFPPCR